MSAPAFITLSISHLIYTLYKEVDTSILLVPHYLIFKSSTVVYIHSLWEIEPFADTILGTIGSNPASKRQHRKSPNSKAEETAGPTTQQKPISLEGKLLMIDFSEVLKIGTFKKFTCFNTIYLKAIDI